jgi:hypothetical protein
MHDATAKYAAKNDCDMCFTLVGSKTMVKREVVPGIEPGLPECPDRIRIRSDNRYTTQPLIRLGHDPLQVVVN